MASILTKMRINYRMPWLLWRPACSSISWGVRTANNEIRILQVENRPLISYIAVKHHLTHDFTSTFQKVPNVSFNLQLFNLIGSSQCLTFLTCWASTLKDEGTCGVESKRRRWWRRSRPGLRSRWAQGTTHHDMHKQLALTLHLWAKGLKGAYGSHANSTKRKKERTSFEVRCAGVCL